jgi:peptidoglycan hydrolase-like protein with peptidoglycan-binding domain
VSTGKVFGGALAVVVLGTAAGAVWFAVAAQPRAAGGGTVAVPTGTAEVTSGTVSERVRVGGTLGFDGTYPVNRLGEPGVLTAVTAAGATVGRGGQLYAVNGRPVRLLYGGTPAYRDLAAGMADGADVRQLEENLVALGADPGHQITVDAHFAAATATAIRRLQSAWGLPAGERTGRLALGQVVFQPGALRVSQVQGVPGTTIGPDQPVLTATSATPAVTAQVTTERRTLIHVGDPVTVTLAGVPPFPGTITWIGRAAGAEPESGGSAPPPMVPVTISVTVPAAAGDLDEAPVDIAITRQTHEHVLLVPVAALLARPGGGYQVRLDDDRYVRVEPGLFDSLSGTVEVTGDLTAGQRVKVPVS